MLLCDFFFIPTYNREMGIVGNFHPPSPFTKWCGACLYSTLKQIIIIIISDLHKQLLYRSNNQPTHTPMKERRKKDERKRNHKKNKVDANYSVHPVHQLKKLKEINFALK
jgi:hypothetical protein